MENLWVKIAYWYGTTMYHFGLSEHWAVILFLPVVFIGSVFFGLGLGMIVKTLLG